MLFELLLFLTIILLLWLLYRTYHIRVSEPDPASSGTREKHHPEDIDDEEENPVRRAVSFEPDGSFQLGDKSTKASVQAYASKIQRVDRNNSNTLSGAGSVAEPVVLVTSDTTHDETDEWRIVASTNVVSDEEREFVASLLRQIDENNRDITQLSARAKDTDRLREQLDELQIQLDEREKSLARLIDMTDDPDFSVNPRSLESGHGPTNRQDSEQVQADTQVELKELREALQAAESKAASTGQNDIELRRLRSELLSVQQEYGMAKQQLDKRSLRIAELEARLDGYRASEEQSDEIIPTRTFASGAVANAAARAASRSTDPKPQASQLRQLYQPPAEHDDLKLIKGIGLKMEQLLNQLGVTTFRQLANFGVKDIEDVSAELKAFSGRIQRDNWIGQAAKLQKIHYGENLTS